MTFLTRQTVAAANERGSSVGPVTARRGWLVAATGIALVGGFVVGHGTAKPVTIDAALVTLLRFMALLKLTEVLGALALSCWRIGHPASLRLALSYAVAIVLMACGPGLIWSMETVVFGALVFHAGLFSFVFLAARDGTRRIARGPAARRRVVPTISV